MTNEADAQQKIDLMTEITNKQKFGNKLLILVLSAEQVKTF